MSIPLNAIDPEAEHRRWVQQFEWHLDLIPPVLDAVIMSTLPTIPVSRGGSRFDRDQVTGGGYIDNMSDALIAFDQSSKADGLAPSRAIADARNLWWLTLDYTRAVAAWVNAEIDAPYAPDLPPLYGTEWVGSPLDADPIGARAHALVVVGWLIERAEFVGTITELGEALDDLFVEVRHLRGVYGVHSSPRRERQPRRRCGTCGEVAVIVDWVSDPAGGPKPVRVVKCTACRKTYTDSPKEGTDEQLVRHVPRGVQALRPLGRRARVRPLTRNRGTAWLNPSG